MKLTLRACTLLAAIACTLGGSALAQSTQSSQSATVIEMGRSGSYQHSASVQMPPKTCNTTAYTAAYRWQYMRHWNNAVRDRLALVRARMLNKPDSAALKAEEAELKAKMFAIDPGDPVLEYFDPTSRDPVKSCNSASFAAGQAEAMQAATRDRAALNRPDMVPAAPTK